MQDYATDSLASEDTRTSHVSPLQVLIWTRDWGKAKELAWQVAAAYASSFKAITEPQPGIREWLHALSKSNVPCAIVTAFDRWAAGYFHVSPLQILIAYSICIGTLFLTAHEELPL